MDSNITPRRIVIGMIIFIIIGLFAMVISMLNGQPGWTTVFMVATFLCCVLVVGYSAIATSSVSYYDEIDDYHISARYEQNVT